MNSAPPTDHCLAMSDSPVLDYPFVGDEIDVVGPRRTDVDSVHIRLVQKGMHRLLKVDIGFLLVGEEVEAVCNPVE